MVQGINRSRAAKSSTNRETFEQYIKRYLDVSKLDYLPSHKSYQATADDLFQQYAGSSGELQVHQAQRKLQLDTISVYAQLYRSRSPSDIIKSNLIHYANSQLTSREGVNLPKAPSSQPILREKHSLRPDSTWARKMLTFARDRPQYLAWVTLLALALLGMSLWMIVEWKDHPRRKELGWQLVVAKCGAQMMKLTFALLPLTVLRGLHTWLENRGLSWMIPKDGMLQIHKLLGHATMWAMLLHVAAHIATYIKMQLRSRGDYMQETFLTGLLLFLFMIALWLYASMWPRTSARLQKHFPSLYSHLNHYTSFARAHLLYIPIFALLLIHVMPNHQIKNASRDTWIWVSLPAVLFALDKLLRTYNQHARQSHVRQMAVLPGRMIALRFARPEGFVYAPGMYVNVRLPGMLQAHPFTLSSAPSDPWLRVHVRVVGDWTEWVHNRLLQAGADWEVSKSHVQVYQSLVAQGRVSSAKSFANSELVQQAVLARQSKLPRSPEPGFRQKKAVPGILAPAVAWPASKRYGVVDKVIQGVKNPCSTSPNTPVVSINQTAAEEPSSMLQSIKVAPSDVDMTLTHTLDEVNSREDLPESSSTVANVDRTSSAVAFDAEAQARVHPEVNSPKAASHVENALQLAAAVAKGQQVRQQLSVLQDAEPTGLSSIKFLDSQPGHVSLPMRACKLPQTKLHLSSKLVERDDTVAGDVRLEKAKETNHLYPLLRLAALSPATTDVNLSKQDQVEGVTLAQAHDRATHFIPHVESSATLSEYEVRSNLTRLVPQAPQIMVDGPYASPLGGILKGGQLAIMVASGSGITPFQSVLREHVHKLRGYSMADKAYSDLDSWQSKSEQQQQAASRSTWEVVAGEELESRDTDPWIRCFDFDSGEFGSDLGLKSNLRAQQLVLVWVVRHFEWLTWIDEELRMLYNSTDFVKQSVQVLVYVTQPGMPDLDSWMSEQAAAGHAKPPAPEMDDIAREAAFLCQQQAVQDAARVNRVHLSVEGGRPNWRDVLGRVLRHRMPQDTRKCGVYVCGGKALSFAIQMVCWEGVNVNGAYVYPQFLKESFY